MIRQQSVYRRMCESSLITIVIPCRNVAQPGSALVRGTSGRRFKSSHSDQILSLLPKK